MTRSGMRASTMPRPPDMERVAPLGDVYQAGTLSGNPLAMTAGYTLLSILSKNPHIYTELAEKTAFLAAGLAEVLTEKGVPHTINQLGSMISVHFCDTPVYDFQSAVAGNNDTFKAYFHGMLERGVYLPPSAFESWFVSNAHTTEDIHRTIAATADFFSK